MFALEIVELADLFKIRCWESYSMLRVVNFDLLRGSDALDGVC